MQQSSVPYKFTSVWASSAGSQYLTSTIPATSTGAAAGQNLGFPPVTALPVGSGGTPPNISDFNGILQYLSYWAQWQQAGGPILYDSTFSSNVGGYPKNALIASQSNPGTYWQSLVDNNTSNPETGGANWLLIRTAPSIWVPFTTSTTWTVTAPTVEYIVIGAGGGGGGNTTLSSGLSYGGTGGGGGAAVVGTMVGLTVGSSLTITIGQGGASSYGGAGSNGTSSSITGKVTANGGGGGNCIYTSNTPGSGGTISSGQYATYGAYGLAMAGYSGGNALDVTNNTSVYVSGGVGGPNGLGWSCNSSGIVGVPGSGGTGAAVNNQTTGTYAGIAGSNGLIILRY